LSENTDHTNDIIKGVIDGLITIESIDEFKNIIVANPDNPELLTVYAGMLEKKELYNGAASVYKKASRHFIESDMILKAIHSKIREWNVIKYSERECRSIYAALRHCDRDDVPAYHFFARMSYPELVAVMDELEPVSLGATAVVREQDDFEDELYFVVLGTLTETTYSSGHEGGAEILVEQVGENGFTGDVLPFSDDKLSLSLIEAASNVALLKLAKEDLIRVCRKYPNVEFLTMELCQSRLGKVGRKALHTIRSTTRYQVQTKVTVKIFPDEPDQSPLVLNGFTEDISMGGCCIRLGEAYWTGSGTSVIGKNVRILFSVPKVSAGVDVLGEVAWKREVSYDERTTVLIGVQFKQMTEEDFTFLKKHCYIGDGEQDMIYSLWESLMKK